MAHRPPEQELRMQQQLRHEELHERDAVLPVLRAQPIALVRPLARSESKIISPLEDRAQLGLELGELRLRHVLLVQLFKLGRRGEQLPNLVQVGGHYIPMQLRVRALGAHRSGLIFPRVAPAYGPAHAAVNAVANTARRIAVGATGDAGADADAMTMAPVRAARALRSAPGELELHTEPFPSRALVLQQFVYLFGFG